MSEKSATKEETINAESRPAFYTPISEDSFMKEVLAVAGLVATSIAIIFSKRLDSADGEAFVDNYVNLFTFWYGVLFVILATIPYLVVLSLGTPHKLYPATRNDYYGNSVLRMLVFNSVANNCLTLLLFIPIYPLLYLFHCYQLGNMTSIEVFIGASVAFMFYYGRRMLLGFANVHYYNVLDIIAMWKFASTQLLGLKGSRNVQN